MRMIATKAGPSDKHDRLRCVRDDGSETAVSMPRQGTLPHDLVHAVVESALGFSDGFIGLVAKGADIAFLSKSFHEHIDPARHAQGVQAESAVESLQGQLWSGRFDEEAFRYGLETACAMRGVAVPELAGCDLRGAMFERVQALHAEWQAIPSHQEWQLRFPLDSVPVPRIEAA